MESLPCLPKTMNMNPVYYVWPELTFMAVTRALASGSL